MKALVIIYEIQIKKDMISNLARLVGHVVNVTVL